MSTVPGDFINRISELTLEEKASLCLGSDFWAHCAGRETRDPSDHGLGWSRTGCAPSSAKLIMSG